MSAYLYSLTALTGRKRNAGRTVILNGFEFGRQGLKVTSISVGLSLPLAITLSFISPLFSIIVPAVFVAAAFFFYESRSRKGLEERRYKAIWHQYKADPKEIYICGRPVSETLGFATLVASSAPVARTRTTEDAPIFSAPTKSTTRASVSDLMKGSPE